MGVVWDRPERVVARVPAVAVAGLGLVVACVGLPPAPPAADGASDSVATTTGPTSTAGSGPSSANGDTTGGGTSEGSVTRGATTRDGGTPVLSISDGPTFDFGLVALDGQGSHLFTVSNEGDGAATGLGGPAPSSPFGFVDGAYPGGLLATCGPELAPGSSCTVGVAFSPVDVGPQAGDFTLVHDDGELTRALVGAGEGSSANLLVNPGGERSGSPPPGWTNEGPGNWVAEGVSDPMPVEGTNVLRADDGPAAVAFVLSQSIAVDQWQSTIDAGALRFSFAGHQRVRDFGDGGRIQVMYLDELGDVLDAFDSGFSSEIRWAVIADVRVAPPGTRTVHVALGCIKLQGALCDAYFDALELFATYP